MGTVDLNALINRAAEDFTGAADARLRLCPAQEPVKVGCDSTRAVQILGNLLSNALKYSPEDATIEVYVERRGDHGVVAVHDQGRGIPADQLERVFEKFHRVEDPMVMQTGGSGLGLYIACHLARAMAGDLEVASSFGQGSQFTLRLPLECALARADREGPSHPADRAGRHDRCVYRQPESDRQQALTNGRKPMTSLMKRFLAALALAAGVALSAFTVASPAQAAGVRHPGVD
jgi:anti-sigma regulatory factor (Ser/Thr protein kinase)